jgi:hypothetical protein
MTDLLKNSVTKDDYIPQPDASGPLSIVIGPSYLAGMLGESGLLAGIKGATGLPARGTWARDAILSESPYLANMWASATALAISKQVSLGFTIDDPEESQGRIKRCQELMLSLGGAWHTGLPKHLRDYLLTSNGAYLEIVRASSASGSRILGLMPLDSLRCYPTEDPNYPVVYLDRFGGYHRMDAENVIRIVDMPSARFDDRGYGMCAADRAWETILKVCAMETYFREKVSGARNLAIHIVNGISDKQLSDALHTGEQSANARGFVVYRGSTIIPMLRQEAPAVVTIPLAEIPDGFNVNDERKDAYLQMANALGVPVQDIQPLSGQGLGTGTQSVVLQEAAQGQGLASWRAAFARMITHHVMPQAVTFAWAINDTREQKQTEEVRKMRADRVIALVTAQIINAEQARNVLVDADDLPPEFLAADVTAGGSVSDQDKVLTEQEQADIAVEAAPQPVAVKAARPIAPSAMVIDDDVIVAANKLRAEVK